VKVHLAVAPNCEKFSPRKFLSPVCKELDITLQYKKNNN